MNIVILGGGISGLSAAWYLRKAIPDAKITLLEKTERLGGLVQTHEPERFLFEKGPRTFLASRSVSLLALIEEVGLKDDLLFSPGGKRFLWHRGKLRSLASFLPGLLPALIREAFLPKKTCEDESIYDFAARRFSPKIAETLFDPMALGVFAGDIKTLSLRTCFPFLYEWEQKNGSIVKSLFKQKKQGRQGPRGLFTLKRGMGSLIQALAERLPAQIVVNCPVESIREGGVEAGGKFWSADWIVSALPGLEIGRLTRKWVEFSSASIWVVNIAFSERIALKKGFGYLVPSQEQEPLLGMIWDSSVFPDQSWGMRLTAMVRDGGDASWARDSALDALRRHLKISAAPNLVDPHFADQAIPQFEVGYAKRLERFQKELKETFPTLSLVGNYLGGASVDACIGISKSLSE